MVGQRPDKLLSDDAQNVWDAAAFRIVHDAKDDVTDMARRAVTSADPGLDPATVSNMTAIEARDYLRALHNSAIQAGDTEEARRLQDLLNELDHYAFEHFTAGIAEAEAAHDVTPLKLPATVDSDALSKKLTELANEQFARIDDTTLTDAERHEMSKLGNAYAMAAQDAEQGLHPLVSIQAIINSGLNHVDSQIYVRAASEISVLLSPVAAVPVRHTAVRSLWARASEIASSLLAFVRTDSRSAGGLSHADEAASVDTPIRFLDGSADARPAAAGPAVDVRLPGPGRAPERAPGAAGPAAALDPVGQPRVSDPPSGPSSGLHPTRDRSGAYWSPPALTTEDAPAPSWTDLPKRAGDTGFKIR